MTLFRLTAVVFITLCAQAFAPDIILVELDNSSDTGGCG